MLGALGHDAFSMSRLIECRVLLSDETREWDREAIGSKKSVVARRKSRAAYFQEMRDPPLMRATLLNGMVLFE
jgi:hypothetical protein